MKVLNWLRRKVLKYEIKEIKIGFAEKCLRCNKIFREGYYFLSATHIDFVDNPVPFHMINRFDNFVFELNEFKNKINSQKQSNTLCYKCFNKYLNTGEIEYDGYEHIKVRSDFFIS